MSLEDNLPFKKKSKKGKKAKPGKVKSNNDGSQGDKEKF